MPNLLSSLHSNTTRNRRLPRLGLALLMLVLGGCASDDFKPSVIESSSFRNPAVGFKGLDLTLPAEWRLVTQKPDPVELSRYARAAYDSLKSYSDQAVGSQIVEHVIWEFEGGAAAILIVTTAHPGASATDKASKKFYADLISTYMRTEARQTERNILEVNGRYVPSFARFYPSNGYSDRAYVSTLPPGFNIVVYGVYGFGHDLEFKRQAEALVEQINR